MNIFIAMAQAITNIYLHTVYLYIVMTYLYSDDIFIKVWEVYMYIVWVSNETVMEFEVHKRKIMYVQTQI